MSLNKVVEAKGLQKKFGDSQVVAGIDLQVYQGECFGILGPNGAGKSTAMQMLYGTLSFTGGEAHLLGINVRTHARELKSRIGVIPQEDGLDTEFTVRENLLLYSGYHGIDQQISVTRASELLRLTRLEDSVDRPVEQLSAGMRRRLAIARGMINQPEILFLDEPTTGLDPQDRLWIWDFLVRIKAEIGTVVLSTRYMEEAELICDRVAIMDQGKILSVGTPKNLIQEHIGREVIELEVAPNELNYYRGRLLSQGYVHSVLRNQIHVHLSADQDSKQVLSVIAGRKLTVRPPTLNDVFLKLAGHGLREDFV